MSLYVLLIAINVIIIFIVILQKVKELTYMHSEGIMSGELKHGPLALIDKAMPVIMIVTRDPVYVVSFEIFYLNSVNINFKKLEHFV